MSLNQKALEAARAAFNRGYIDPDGPLTAALAAIRGEAK